MNVVPMLAAIAIGTAGLSTTSVASAADTLTLTSQVVVTLPIAGNPNPVPRTATDYTFRTSALTTPTMVRVMFPRDYVPGNGKRYPVLYLLHGGAADYRSWTATGGTAQHLTDGLDLIVVMPDAGRSAWYTDWYNNGAGGTPKWETFHIHQLIGWVDANLPTIPKRSARAIAGLSSGGFGTMSYASRHPDLFVAAAAFSGALDTNTPPVISGKVIDGLAAQDGGGPGSLFGLRETQEVRWRGHNPWDLATNLRDTNVTVRAGNAFPPAVAPSLPGTSADASSSAPPMTRASASTSDSLISGSITSGTTTAPARTTSSTGTAGCSGRCRSSWTCSRRTIPTRCRSRTARSNRATTSTVGTWR